jgi:hypothetical protein
MVVLSLPQRVEVRGRVIVIVLVVHHTEPLGEEAALTTEGLATLHTDPLTDEVALAVAREVRIVLHTGEPTARQTCHKARLGGATASFTQGVHRGGRVTIRELTAAKHRLLGGLVHGHL